MYRSLPVVGGETDQTDQTGVARCAPPGGAFLEATTIQGFLNVYTHAQLEVSKRAVLILLCGTRVY